MMQTASQTPLMQTVANDSVVVLLDQALKQLSVHSCCGTQVSFLALCDLLGRKGKDPTRRLQHEYRAYAKRNDVPIYTLKRIFPNDKSNRTTVGWIDVHDAVGFISLCPKKNAHVCSFLNVVNTNEKIQEVVAEKDKELEQEREEHATQQEFDQAAIQTLSNENKELKKRAGRDWKLLDSLPLEKRGKFSAILTSEKAVLAALEASKEIDKHLKATTSEFKDIRYDMCGVQKGTTTRMMNQSHLKPKQVRECLESAGADCGLLIQSSKKTDLRDNKTKLAILAKAAECTGVYKYLQRTKAREEEINKVDEGYIKPQWEDEANKKTTTCLLSAYAYDSGLETDRCRDIEGAIFFLDDYEKDPTGWPKVEDLNGRVTSPQYFKECLSYEKLRQYCKEQKLSTPSPRHGFSLRAKGFWREVLAHCQKYSAKDIPPYLFELYNLLQPRKQVVLA